MCKVVGPKSVQKKRVSPDLDDDQAMNSSPSADDAAISRGTAINYGSDAVWPWQMFRKAQTTDLLLSQSFTLGSQLDRLCRHSLPFPHTVI